MSKGKRAALSLGWAFGIITFVIILFATSMTYAAELDDVRAALQSTGAAWVAEENSISILPREERAKRLGALEPKSALGMGADEFVLSPVAGELPTKFSWKNYNGGNYVTAIKDQGSCGSCWAFATTAGIESKTLMSPDWSGGQVNLSEQIVLSCSGAGNCQTGGYIDQASSFLRYVGTNKESCYPYTGGNGNCANACSTWQVRPYKISGWSWVGSGTSPSVDTLKNAIYTYGPIVAYMDVYTDFYFYSYGIYTPQWGYHEGGHAILIVGWNDDKRFFTCKNSWGTNWGESGYFRISYNELGGFSNLAKWSIAYGDVGPVSVNLLTPTAGEPLASGSLYSIQWQVPDSIGNFTLHYSLDNGTTWKLIAEGLTGTSYDWIVPEPPNNKKACLVRIQEFDAASGKKLGEDKSSPFTIEVVKLTYPNGAETLNPGPGTTIIWQTNGTKSEVANVKLYLSKDGGITWAPITTIPAPDPGTYSWTVPNVTSSKTKCKVKVVLKDAGGNVVGSDMSDSTFTINPPL